MRNVVLIFSILISFCSHAQDEPEIFVIIENMPVHKKCSELKSKPEKQECTMEKLKLHIKKNTVYPEKVEAINISGSIDVRFLIGEDGSIIKEETKILAGFTGEYGDLFNQEALRVINSIPPLIPAFTKDKYHKVQYTLPVYFVNK